LIKDTFKAGWLTIDQSSDPDYFVRLMDKMRGGKDDDPVQYRAVFDLIDVQDGEQVLDVGCGTGGAVRALAPHAGSAGHVVGVDLSATMIAEAGKRADGLELPIEFHVADAHHLPFADNAFDKSYSLRVFEIIDMPREVLAEMVRVTRSGGRIVVNGPDMDLWAIDSSNREVTRKILHYVCDHETNGWVGRQLPGWCQEMGLKDIQLVPTILINTDFNVLYDLCLRDFVERTQSAGAVSEEEVTEWFDDLRQRDHEGRFLCTQTLFRVAAQKP